MAKREREKRIAKAQLWVAKEKKVGKRESGGWWLGKSNSGEMRAVDG